IRVVGDLAPNLPEAIPRLTALFPEIEAVRAVARYGPAGGPAVAELTELLKDNNATVRWQAVRTLGKLRDSAISALPKIVDRLTADPDPLVREHAAEAVGDIGPGAAEGIPALVKALQDPVAKVRRDAVRSLGQMGKAAEGVIAEVRKSELDPDPEVSGAATRAVRLIDPTATRKH
ncbi:MAG TPA: HEAT repeat domain-containing protein, partial [Gemmata sp.]|nr:HEAT repeat domain-containing protein [Gemmata sp.]